MKRLAKIGAVYCALASAQAKAAMLVLACPETSWVCQADATTGKTVCGCQAWEALPYEVGILPALSVADAQTIAVSGLTVLAGVWGITKIGRLIAKS